MLWLSSPPLGSLSRREAKYPQILTLTLTLSLQPKPGEWSGCVARCEYVLRVCVSAAVYFPITAPWEVLIHLHAQGALKPCVGMSSELPRRLAAASAKKATTAAWPLMLSLANPVPLDTTANGVSM